MNWKNIFPKENIYFETENGILYKGDSGYIMKEFHNKSVDLILTDPPYGINFNNNKNYNDSKEYVFSKYDKWIKLMFSILKENNHSYFFIPTLESDNWIRAIKDVFNFNNILAFQSHNNNIYIKNNFSFDLQLIIYASKFKAKNLNKIDWIPTSKSWLKDKRNKEKNPYTYKYPSFNKFVKATEKNNNFKRIQHGNQKSEELIKKLILLSTNEKDIVLDPFIGSGTTAVACEKLNRKWIGIELNKEYCEITKQRILNINK